MEGWNETELEVCCQTYNNPYQRENRLHRHRRRRNGQRLTSPPMWTSPCCDLGSLVLSGGTSGENEGHRFDIASTRETSSPSATTPISTRLRPVLHPHRRAFRHLVGDGRHPPPLDARRIFPPAGFGATGSQSSADQAQVFAGGAWTIYWLDDENDADPHRPLGGAADAGMADQGATVIPPGQGLFFNNRTGATSVLAYGEVRANDFVRPLAGGNNSSAAAIPSTSRPTDRRPRDDPLTFFSGSQ